jgi:phenylpropionate dioxygenase-like ring-hydroxylating dioxygenase large terminal subunit
MCESKAGHGEGADHSTASTDSGRPSFSEAKSARHKARLSGMHPNYWYPIEWSKSVRPGKIVEATWWGEAIAVYRTREGDVRATENRCPHRQIKLSMGHVKDCKLVCIYHGWTFDAEGKLVEMKHDNFGKKLPVINIRTYPVRERYGIIWIWPGDPKLADAVPLPEISVAEGANKWAHLAFDFTWKAHHYMVMDNLCNLTHLYVHGKWVPYDVTTLGPHKLEGDRIELEWHHTLRKDPLVYGVYKKVFGKPETPERSDTKMVYDYPYQRVLSNDRILSTNFMCPIDAGHTRVFTIQYWKAPKIPLTRVSVPRALMQEGWARAVLPIAKEIFRQDGATVEGEQDAVMGEHFNAPMPEPNPSVRLFERLSIERWETWLAEKSGQAPKLTTRVKKLY